jgi:hypothetical protein
VLTYDELVVLEEALRNEQVLSVYVDGTVTDPARKRNWRLELEREVRAVRKRVAQAPAEERKSFERCASILSEQVIGMTGAVGAPGWVAFVTTAGVERAESLAVPVRTQVTWGHGIRVSPYIRVLKQARPVVVCLADASEVKIYRYWDAQLERLKPVEARPRREPAYHLGHPPLEHFHPGVRGATGHDAAHDASEVAATRMLASAAERSLRYAHNEGYILVAGVPRIRAQAAEMIGRQAAGRVLEIEPLDVHATESEIIAAASAGASRLRNQNDLSLVRQLLDLAGPNGYAALGALATKHAIERSNVRELLLTARYLDEHPEDAEEAVRAAMRQGASVEHVSGKAAEQLDQHGGIAARLRFEVKNV